MLVCRDHMMIGLKVETVPHVRKLQRSERRNCRYCQNTAYYQLYTFKIPGGWRKRVNRRQEA